VLGSTVELLGCLLLSALVFLIGFCIVGSIVWPSERSAVEAKQRNLEPKAAMITGAAFLFRLV
jgi:hypothetical protein